MSTLFDALVTGNPTLPQAVIFAAIVGGVIFGGAKLVDAGIDVYRAITGKTDKDIEAVAYAVDELARAYRDGVCDQLDVLNEISKTVDEGFSEVLGYRPVARVEPEQTDARDTYVVIPDQI